MGIRLLGPLEVDGARRLERRDRVVLCVLAVRRGHVVSPGQIADAVWGDEPPKSWAKQVQICIARLRRAVGPEAIETVAGGYRLTIGGDELDTARFTRLVERGAFLFAAGDPDGAMTSYSTALSLWRGTPLDDVDGWDAGRSEAARYEEMRRAAEEGCLEARLAAGDHRAVATDAVTLADAEPLRERRWAILALALYRGSRQADALRAIARARQVLREQIGIDPGPELASLETAILQQDPALNLVPQATKGRETCPYKGLASYEDADAEEFFGRQVEIDACLARLDAWPLLLVVGPSGCGKSSLVRAGVVPALRRAGCDVVVVVPGPEPIEAITPQLGPEADGVVVVIDQLEDLFAVGRADGVVDEVARRMVEHTQHGGRLIVCLRSDHLGNLGTTRELRHLAEGGLHLIGPLDGDDLREAIQGPAALSGLHLESGLVELLVRDSEGEAGALPLLSHALVETWRLREANTLTVNGYRSTGGIQGAVALTAERLYEGLADHERDTLRSILLRLVTPAVTGDPIRCQRPSRSLLGTPERERVMGILVRARLVTAQDESFALSHEALTRAWPRFQAWLDDDVSGQRVMRHLVMAADGWDSVGRAEGELYRGARLEAALEWQAAVSPELTGVEAAFLLASRELNLAEGRALADRAEREARQNRRLWRLVAGVAGLLVVAVVVGAIAVDQAQRARSEARVATTRELAAASNAKLDADPELSVLLALAALDRAEPDGSEAWAAEEALHRALTTSHLERRISEVGGRVDWSPRGDVLAAIAPGGVGTVEIRDVKTGDRLRSISVGSSAPTDVAFNAQGDLLGITSRDGFVRIVDPTTATTVRTMAGSGTRASGPSFSADGSTFATAWPEDSGGLVRVLSLETGKVLEIGSLPGAQTTSLSPDGARLAVGMSETDHAPVIDVVSGDTVVDLVGHRFAVTGVSWSPNGRFIATAGYDGSARVFDAASGANQVVIPGHRAEVSAVAWSPDSLRLATASADGTARVWSLIEGGARGLVSLSAPDNGKGVTDVAFSPDGTRLLTAERSGSSSIIWNIGVDGGAEVGNLPSVAGYMATRFSGDGRYLFTTGNGGSVRVWDARTLAPVRRLAGADRPAPPQQSMIPGVSAFAFGDVGHIAPTSDGQVIATLNDQAGLTGEGLVPVWDVATGEQLFSARVGSVANYAEWSPDGRVLAIAGADENAGSITMIDRRGQTLQVIRVPGLYVSSVAFTHDGGRLLTTLESLGSDYDPEAGRIAVWDWRNGTELQSIETEAWYVEPGASDDTIVTAPHPAAESQVVTVWSLRTGEAVTTLAGLSGAVNLLSVDPSGTRIATAGSDGVVQIWDATAGASLLTLPGHLGAVTFLDFDAEGSRLASGGHEGVVRVWELDRTALIRIAEARLTRDLTEDECRQFLHGLNCDGG